MNVLLTSAGRRSYLVKYFKEALAGKGEVHASNSEWTTALEVADKAVLTPIIYDASYIEFLLSYSLENEIRIIISLFDIDLPVLAKAKDEFEKHGIKIIVSDFDVTQICNDKWETYNFLIRNNFKTPKSFIDIEEAKLSLNRKVINFPVIIKPRWGMGSISVFRADNEIELRVFYDKVKREIENSYLKFESESDSNNSVLIQEFLKGQEYGLDVVNDLKKQYRITFVKEKTVMRAGETDGAITVEHSVLQDLGMRLGSVLGHMANLDVDCFIVKGVPFVLELNCRFGGGYPFSHVAGANLPLAIIKWANGGEDGDELTNYNVGIASRKDISLMSLKSFQ